MMLQKNDAAAPIQVLECLSWPLSRSQLLLLSASERVIKLPPPLPSICQWWLWWYICWSKLTYLVVILSSSHLSLYQAVSFLCPHCPFNLITHCTNCLRWLALTDWLTAWCAADESNSNSILPSLPLSLTHSLSLPFASRVYFVHLLPSPPPPLRLSLDYQTKVKDDQSVSFHFLFTFLHCTHTHTHILAVTPLLFSRQQQWSSVSAAAAAAPLAIDICISFALTYRGITLRSLSLSVAFSCAYKKVVFSVFLMRCSECKKGECDARSEVKAANVFNCQWICARRR